MEHKKIFFRKILFWFDALYRPVAAKPFVLEDFVLGMGTSVASALTAETVFEIMKCIADVDMLPRGCMGSKCKIFRFFNSGYAHDRNISIFRHRASTVTGNTLIKPNYASWGSRGIRYTVTCTTFKNWRRYSTKTAIMDKVVIAMYRLRPIQKQNKCMIHVFYFRWPTAGKHYYVAHGKRYIFWHHFRP